MISVISDPAVQQAVVAILAALLSELARRYTLAHRRRARIRRHPSWHSPADHRSALRTEGKSPGGVPTDAWQGAPHPLGLEASCTAQPL